MPKSDNLTSSYTEQIELEKSAARQAERAEQRKGTLPFTKPTPLGSQAYIKELEKAKTKVETEVLRQQAKTVKLDTGERVDKEKFDALTKEQQSQLKTLGIDEFNKQLIAKEEAQVREAQIVQPTVDLSNAVAVGAGEYMSLSDFNSLTPEQQNMVRALGVTGYNERLKSQAQAVATQVSIPRDLPQGITKEQVQDLQVNAVLLAQKADSLAASLSSSKNIPSAFFDWVSGKVSSDIPQETLSQYVDIQESLADSDEWAQYFAAVKGSQTAKSYSDFFKTYTTDYANKEFTAIPTTEDVDAVIASTMPIVIDATKAGETFLSPSFDVAAAIKAGLPEAKLAAIGISPTTISAVKVAVAEQAKIQPYITDGTIDLWGALQGGITAQELKSATGLDNQRLIEAIGGDAQTAYDYSISSGNSPAVALDYAINYVKSLYATTGYTTAQASIPLLEVPTAPSFIVSERKPTEAGVVYKEALDYLQANPTIALTGDAIAPLMAMGFDLQAITNAQNAYNQIKQVQEQQAALDKINTVIPPKEIPAFRVGIGDIAFIEDLKTKGYTDEQIRQAIADRSKPSDLITTETEPQYTAEALALFIINNPDDGTETLKTAGFNDTAINTAVEVSKMPYDDVIGFYREGTAPTIDTYRSARLPQLLTQYGITEKQYNDVTTNPSEYGYLSDNPDMELLTKIGDINHQINTEYDDKYGDAAFYGSVFASPLSMVFAPARALSPDVTIRDISGAEWALGAGQVLALASLPFGGITGGIIGKALDIGASAAFAANTAMEWDDLSYGQKIWGIAGNIGFLVLPYALGKLGQGVEMLKAYANPETRKLVQLASDAGAAVRKVEAIRAAESLETGALFTKTAGALQTAEGEARMLTTRLLDSLSRLEDISPSLLKAIESKSGIKIAEITTEVGKAAKTLKDAKQKLAGAQSTLSNYSKGEYKSNIFGNIEETGSVGKFGDTIKEVDNVKSGIKPIAAVDEVAADYAKSKGLSVLSYVEDYGDGFQSVNNIVYRDGELDKAVAFKNASITAEGAAKLNIDDAITRSKLLGYSDEDIIYYFGIDAVKKSKYSYLIENIDLDKIKGTVGKGGLSYKDGSVLAEEAKKAYKDVVEAQSKFDKAMLKYADVMTGAEYERGSTLLARERETAIVQTLNELDEAERYARTSKPLVMIEERISAEQRVLPELEETITGEPYTKTLGLGEPKMRYVEYTGRKGQVYGAWEARPYSTKVDAEILDAQKALNDLEGFKQSTKRPASFESDIKFNQATGNIEVAYNIKYDIDNPFRYATETSASGKQFGYFEKREIPSQAGYPTYGATKETLKPMPGFGGGGGKQLALAEPMTVEWVDAVAGQPGAGRVLPWEVGGKTIPSKPLVLPRGVPYAETRAAAQAIKNSAIALWDDTIEALIDISSLSAMNKLVKAAQSLGLSDYLIRVALAEGTLARVVIAQGIKVLPSMQAAQLYNIVANNYAISESDIDIAPSISRWKSNLPSNLQEIATSNMEYTVPLATAQQITFVDTKPEIVEWQQVSEVIAPEIMRQADTSQLSQLQQAQQIIAKVNADIKQSISQQPTIQQASQLEQSQQVITQVATQIATQTAVDTATPTQLGTEYKYPPEEYKPPTGETPKPPEPKPPTPKIPSKGGSKEEEKERKRKEFEGAVTFKHGIMYRAWKYPYENDEEDLASFWKYPPPGALIIPNVKTAQGTLQLYLGNTPPPPDRVMHMGIVDFSIHSTPDGKLEIKATENREAASGYDDWLNDHPRGAHTHKVSKSRVKESTASTDTSEDDFAVRSA